MIVSQLINRNGNPAANQFVIHEDNGDIAFQSYSSRVCEIRFHGGMGFDKVVVLGRDWDYSNTTLKHLRIFLEDNGVDMGYTADIRKCIERGYILGNESVAVIYDDTMLQ